MHFKYTCVCVMWCAGDWCWVNQFTRQTLIEVLRSYYVCWVRRRGNSTHCHTAGRVNAQFSCMYSIKIMSICMQVLIKLFICLNAWELLDYFLYWIISSYNWIISLYNCCPNCVLLQCIFTVS